MGLPQQCNLRLDVPILRGDLRWMVGYHDSIDIKTDTRADVRHIAPASLTLDLDDIVG